MFGYVKIDTPELLVREHEYYKGTYCGLCHAMGRCTGQCSRLTLSYDVAFLALIRLALANESTSFSQKRCIAHPFRKRNVMDKNDELDYCAYASALLSYHKIIDDLNDEHWLRRMATRLFLLPTARRMRKKAIREGELMLLDESCGELLGQISELERKSTQSVDEPAEIFGRFLGEMFASGLDGSKKIIAHSVGHHIGRWIYIADALDDMLDDKEKGRYNPFLLLYGSDLPSKEQSEDIAVALKLELMGAERALDLIDWGEDTTIKNIVFNILYRGMPQRIDAIINKNNEKQKEKTN